jgi:phytoene dehydrogenase-like protein
VSTHDAVVVGAGPNGLAASVVLARAGLRVLLIEREDSIGGAAKTQVFEQTEFRFDFGSAIHPLALASPFFTSFELEQRVSFVVPEVSYAHPFTDGRCGVAYRDLATTVEHLGRDGRAWGTLFEPLVNRAEPITAFASDSLIQTPKHPSAAFVFAARVLEQGSHLWNARFRDDIAPAMLSGLFAHNINPQPSFASTAAGMLLGALGHVNGWPVPIGGSQSIVDALATDFLAHGGEIHTGRTVTSLDEISPKQLALLDISTDQLLRLGEGRLPARYRRALSRFQFGPGVAKVDFALNAPVPWRSPELSQTATVHLGGTREQIQDAERQLSRGVIAEHPYVLVAQPSLFDASRAPAGMHTLWAYIHVPHGSAIDATELITAEIERYAPGFRDVVLFSSSTSAVELGEQDINFVGGDYAAGATTLGQLIARPTLGPNPWATPLKNVYLCSSATAPGPGVHGMSGYRAALLALSNMGVSEPDLRR